MKYGKTFILLVLAIFLFSLTGAFASEIDTPVASEDTGQLELSVNEEAIEDNLQTSEENTKLAVDENNETLSYEIDAEILTADQFTYTNLKEQIGSGGNINLNKGTYTYNDGDGDTIRISTSGVINGNGAVIDMAQSGHRAFYVTVTDVTIKNLTIKNANYNGNGGAIYFSSSGTVTNCNFTNNSASYGGAIRFNGEGTVTNCNFTNNKATGDGGAVYFVNVGNVSNCNFTDNTAEYNGGAVYFFYNGEVRNCNFTNNKATGDSGAVYFDWDGTVTNCNFTNNSASSDGGAVYFDWEGTVENCNFINNSANNGGAVYFLYDVGTVTNCNFTNNKATGEDSWGGAIYMFSGSVENCNFTNNKVTGTNSWGGAIMFAGTGNVTNCNFTNNTASGDGGAVFFYSAGIVTNCNFTGNKASGDYSEGGAIFIGDGSVENCNFTNNSASGDGGAINMGTGTVTNCNFTNNSASGDGGAIKMYSGTVENCNFTNNSAISGGAINMVSGTVSNCNFTGNNATTGSAIYFYSTSASKTVSNSRLLNNRANAEVLEVIKNDNNITITFTGNDNLLNAIYSRNDAEVTFTNVTYWGAKGITTVSAKLSGSNKEEGQNITVKGVVNGKIIDKINGTDENGEIVLDDTGDYWIIVSHKGDLYYTEIAETLFTNMKLYANVTSLTTNNKTVNITAKSNIFSEFMPGKLLFILPNGTLINASYAGNGTWWAVHTFGNYTTYEINVSYIGLSNVTFNNATITIAKANSTIDIDDVVLNYGDSVNVTATTEGAIGITAKIGNDTVSVTNYTLLISGLNAGTYALTVTTIPDEVHNPANKTVSITVNKVNSTLTINGNITFDYNAKGFATVSFTNATGVNAIVVGQPNAIVNVVNNTITVSGLVVGTYVLNVTTIVDANNCNALTKTANITVNKIKTELSADAITTTYNINKNLVITLKDSTGKALSDVKVTVDLNGVKEYVTDSNGQVKVATKALDPKSYTAKITFNGNNVYDKSAKDVKVTVKKAAPKLTAKKKTFKKAKKVKKYTVTLKNNVGKAMAKVKLTLKVKGKTYKAKTNAKGKAVFKIKNLKKKGKYRATVKFAGNTYYSKVTKKVKITVK